MAEHTIETIFRLRYATYAQWMNSNLILKVGEPAIATFPNARTIENLSNALPDYTPPAIGIKIGDGVHYFYELPWVQAIAADVYNWAKQIDKPTYSASEIQGLETYIEEHGGGSGGGSSGATVARRYQLFQGTGLNANKYYLRYRDDDESNWTVDYNYYIDLNSMVELLEWIGDDVHTFSSLGNRTDDHISYRLDQLSKTDTEVNHFVVTSVSQQSGLITVTRKQLEFDDINGTLGVEKGGTGKTTFEPGEVLVGNGENPFGSLEVATGVANERNLVYNYAIKAYVDAAVAALAGAMHFIGDATVPITGAVDPQIVDYDFSKARPGDVVLYEQKEYVWTGSGWRLLGDESSYAIKGSIRDSDIDAEANIQMSKIADLLQVLNSKVDKVEGKQLSTNDFTNEYRQKLDNIENGAQANIIEHVFLNDTEIPPTTVNSTPNSIDLHIKEFDDESNEKLQSIATGAQVNTIERITVDGQEVTPGPNKTVALVTDPHTEHENIIEAIYINDTQYYPDQHKAVHITLDESALNLHILEGAQIPGENHTKEEVEVVDKKLQLERVAKTGKIDDLIQDSGTYIIFYGGTSTEVI